MFSSPLLAARTFRPIKIGRVLLVPAILLTGCGGSGGGGGGAGSTNITAGAISLTPSTTPAQITAQTQSLGLTLSYSGPTATYLWSLNPGVEGTLQTVSGQSFPTTATSLTTAVYVGNPNKFAFGNADAVNVQAVLTNGSTGLNTSLQIPLGSDYATLPPPISNAAATQTTDKPLYAPGSTISSTVRVTPSATNTSVTIEPPLGFVPGAVTVNGSSVTLPMTYPYSAHGFPFTLTVAYTIPAGTGNVFPVASVQGQTGTWLVLTGAPNWTVSTPFFIHS